MKTMTPVLVEHAKRGDAEAWSDLVRTYAGLVHGLCHRSTPDPEDAFQETWVRIHANLHRFDPSRGTLKAWIAAITRRHLIDRYRRRERRGTLVALPLQNLQTKDDPHRNVARQLERKRLEAAIARLPDIQRTSYSCITCTRYPWPPWPQSWEFLSIPSRRVCIAAALHWRRCSESPHENQRLRGPVRAVVR